MKNENCIFCKLANGDIPTATLYEDDDFRVILDAGPASKGHALILPKEHYANLYELDDELAAKVLVLAKKMITKLTALLDGTADYGKPFFGQLMAFPQFLGYIVQVNYLLENYKARII